VISALALLSDQLCFPNNFAFRTNYTFYTFLINNSQLKTQIMLALTIQTTLFVLFALLVSLFFTAQLYKIVRRNTTLKVFAPGIAFAILQIIAAIFF
jgi:hypothetical protein